MSSLALIKSFGKQEGFQALPKALKGEAVLNSREREFHTWRPATKKALLLAAIPLTSLGGGMVSRARPPMTLGDELDCMDAGSPSGTLDPNHIGL